MPVTHEVASSTLVTPAIIAQIAQSVEQGTENPRVGGSIPPLGTIQFYRRRRRQVVRQRSAKSLFTSSNLVVASKIRIQTALGLFFFILCAIIEKKLTIKR